MGSDLLGRNERCLQRRRRRSSGRSSGGRQLKTRSSQSPLIPSWSRSSAKSWRVTRVDFLLSLHGHERGIERSHRGRLGDTAQGPSRPHRLLPRHEGPGRSRDSLARLSRPRVRQRSVGSSLFHRLESRWLWCDVSSPSSSPFPWPSPSPRPLNAAIPASATPSPSLSPRPIINIKLYLH